MVFILYPMCLLLLLRELAMQPCVFHYSLLTLTNVFAINTCLKFISNYTKNPVLQIQLPDGLIQGKMKYTVDLGMPYFSYEGIPYAKPPVGKLRFKSPEPPLKWNGILDASDEFPACIQIMPPSSSPDRYESEDCLYINVYVPKPSSMESTTLKPVMVWIYGGGFQFGTATATYYGPDFLLEENVIVVHFNYRLNVFGFLSTEDLASPGNYGLKDQLLALKWIRNNIQHFGGDPNKITIFGESAGGASVQYQLISAKSRGLFQRAISESGSALCPWALQTNPARVAFQIGYSTGFPGGDSDELIEYLRNLSTRRLKRAAMRAAIVNSINVGQSLTFSPCVEPDHEDAIVTGSTYEKLKNGEFPRVPYIVGFNSLESGKMRTVLELGEPFLSLVSEEILVPPALNIDSNTAKLAGEEIKEFYFTSAKSTSQQFLNFISDSYFYRPITESARLYSIYAPIYMYRFSYDGYFLGKKAFSMGEESNVNGAMHAEEIWYIFSRSDLGRANETDKLIRKRMVKLWTNFAKFGNPTPYQEQLIQNLTWPNFKEDDDYGYLDIDSNLTLQTDFKRNTMEFWKQLFTKYGRPPFDTY